MVYWQDGKLNVSVDSLVYFYLADPQENRAKLFRQPLRIHQGGVLFLKGFMDSGHQRHKSAADQFDNFVLLCLKEQQDVCR